MRISDWSSDVCSSDLKGLPAVKIKSVKAIATAPQGSNLIVVKVETTEPGLYGLGCATFTQRAVAAVAAIEGYMNDFCVGKDVRSEERRVGKECVSTCRSRWSQ